MTPGGNGFGTAPLIFWEKPDGALRSDCGGYRILTCILAFFHVVASSQILPQHRGGVLNSFKNPKPVPLCGRKIKKKWNNGKWEKFS